MKTALQQGEGRTCNTCCWWIENVVRGGLGECRRMPPLPAFEPMGRVSRISPVTGAYFWCGEHKAVPAEPTAEAACR